ncbi:MAG: UDP-glucose dehydrogenase family protein [Thermoplasmataceae archaeon]
MGEEEISMRIGVVGLGYVGLVTAAVLASHGNEIIGVDIIRERIEHLNTGTLPIYEPLLNERIIAARKNLNFTNQFHPLVTSDAIFICVPTPNKDNKVDLSYVFSASKTISEHGYSGPIIIKSTVPPGTARKVSEAIGNEVISNPEFTREGSAVSDTENPDRVIIGGTATEIARKIWEFTGASIVITTNENAELIKYASNAFLATKISFINQIADLCETIPGADVKVVAKGMGLDQRIGKEFLNAGLGYGGSCFPKDTVAISSFARDKGVDLSIIDSVISYNESRVQSLVKRVSGICGSLKGRNICVLGLSFKDNTDDLRESRAVALINELKKQEAVVTAYDPVVRNYDNIKIYASIEECLSSADIVITATEWKEFREIDPAMLSNKMVFDLRRVFNTDIVDIEMGVGIGKN